MSTQKYETTYEDVREALEQLGLDTYESKFYLFIATHEPTSASALSVELAVDRTKAYRTVASLVQKGLVSQTLDNPKLCIISDCATAIDGIIREWEEKFLNGKKNKDKIVEFIESVLKIKNKSGKTPSNISVLNSRGAFNSHFINHMRRCDSNVFIYTNATDLMRMYYTDIPDSLKRLSKKGKECIIITDKDSTKISKLYKGCKVIKIRKEIHGRIIVIEDQLVIMSSKLELGSHINSSNDINLAIQEPQIISNMQHFFKMVLNT